MNANKNQYLELLANWNEQKAKELASSIGLDLDMLSSDMGHA